MLPFPNRRSSDRAIILASLDLVCYARGRKTINQKEDMKIFALLTLGVIVFTVSRPVRSAILVGDLANSFDALGRLPSDYGWAQEITIGNGVWNLTAAEVYVGNQFPGYPAVPVVQIRNVAAGNVPGNTVLGSFTMNPNDIPAWESGVNNLAAVSAPADSSIVLGPGIYWLCMMNFAPSGSYDVINVGFTTSPPQQSGAIGNTVNDTTLAVWDGTNFSSVTASFAHQTLLVELDGQPVPEPSVTLWAAAGAVIALLLRRRLLFIKVKAEMPFGLF